MPPVAARLCAYGTPAIASVSGDGVTNVRFDVTARVNCFDTATELLSITCAVNVKLPPRVGTPEIVAVAASKESAAGRPPALMLHMYGAVPPTAASVREYGIPAVACGNSGAVEITNAAATVTLNTLLALRARPSLTSTV